MSARISPRREAQMRQGRSKATLRSLGVSRTTPAQQRHLAKWHVGDRVRYAQQPGAKGRNSPAPLCGGLLVTSRLADVRVQPDNLDAYPLNAAGVIPLCTVEVSS